MSCFASAILICEIYNFASMYAHNMSINIFKSFSVSTDTCTTQCVAYTSKFCWLLIIVISNKFVYLKTLCNMLTLKRNQCRCCKINLPSTCILNYCPCGKCLTMNYYMFTGRHAFMSLPHYLNFAPIGSLHTILFSTCT